MAELIGGAFLSAFFQSLFERIDSGEIVDFFRGRKQVGLLERLKITLLSVEVVLDDAEMKQMRNPGVKHWLEGLKDAAEDAENLLDEISTYALEAKILSAESGTKCSPICARGFFSGFFDSRCRDRKAKMEETLGRLEYFASQKDILGLSIVAAGRVSRRLPSTSLLEDSEMYGRKDDKDALKKSVLCYGAKAVSVIPIVGMGGVGKTTLVQALFNDDEVKKDFEVKVWVCVSEDFDVCKTTKTMLEVVTNSSCDTMELNTLQVRLKEKLHQKKFLVVLDDVWNENYDDWNVLRRPFQDGAKGSKIIVTTRSEKVASVMGSFPIHHLKELSDGDCWELFAKHASGNGDFVEAVELEVVGREIAKKCKGLPLVAKTLGGLLRSTLNVGEWKRVLESDIWDFTDEESNILPALRVSYHYLPSHLKRCFAYCSMFPKDYEFKKEWLVLLWMAENLLGHSKGNKRIEDVGDEYFNDLVSRSFFQRMSNEYRSWFVMHDLIVDLAKFVSGNSFQHEGVETSSEGVNNLRHFAYYPGPYDSYKRLNYVHEATRLRTFLPLHGSLEDNISDRVVRDLIMKFKCLRSLSLCGYHNITQLPDSIGELKHLRYLNLAFTSVSQLPESLCGLYNLQTLDLLFCEHLKSFPRYMYRLINLRCLRINEGFLEMPTQMGKLRNLQTLDVYIVGKDGETGIRELQELSNLRGSLYIKNLRNIVNSEDASKAKLMDKRYIRNLSLDWGDGGTIETAHEKLVLEKLAPSTAIERVDIYHYGGMRFPNWFEDYTYSNIVKMNLSNCKNCTSLPALGQLGSLKSLTIREFLAIETVDHGFYRNSDSSSLNPFPSLENLELSKLSNWNEWHPMQTEDVVAFPQLKTLRIEVCPKLIGNLPHSFPSLTKIVIYDCPLVNCSLSIMPVLQTLKLVGCENLVSQDLPPTINSLVIGGCGDYLVSLSERLMAIETFLQYLTISGCPHVATLAYLPASLKTLKIRDCENLEFQFPHLHESLVYIEISRSCDSIQHFPLNSFPNLNSLDICGLKNLESLSLDGACEEMASLSYLSIDSCQKFVSFSSGGFFAPKLNSIWFINCEKLKCWPEKIHILFPSLDRLETRRCPELEPFPGTGLPSNTRVICIEKCEKLIASRGNWNLARLTKLDTFSISNSAELRCFPEEGVLPASITSLEMNSVSHLEILDEDGLRQLTSLKFLVLRGCPKLRTIPVAGLPNSLQVLEIIECPLLDYKKLKKQIRDCPNENEIYVKIRD